MARLAAAVHLTDPKTRRPIVLQPGEEPAPHLAALITFESAWEDGILPDLPSADTDDDDGGGDDGGQASEADTASTPDGSEAPAEEKPARKTASRKPAAN